MQLPRLYNKEAKDAAAGPAPKTTKTLAIREETGREVYKTKTMLEGRAWRWMEPRSEACRMGTLAWSKQWPFRRRRGGQKTNVAPTYVFVSAEKTLPGWPDVGEGESMVCFLCLFGMVDPPVRKTHFLLLTFYADNITNVYTGREVPYKLHGGGGYCVGGRR